MSEKILVLRARRVVGGIPLASLAEIMRPLAAHPVPGSAPYLRGVSIIRGHPVPVVDLGGFLGAEGEAKPTRLVVVRAGDRSVALAVEEVLGIRDIEGSRLEALPPLLRDARPDVLASAGVLDGQFMLVLQAARCIPDDLWTRLEAEA